MLLEDFEIVEGECNLVAAAQQTALCCMVYEDDAEAIRAMLQPESELVYFNGARETWVPAIAVCRSGEHRYFVCCEGTISFTQALAQGSPMNMLTPVTDNESTETNFYGLFYYQVYKELFKLAYDVIPFNDPRLQLYLSGHSMGGAVAQVAAFEFARTIDRERVQLLTVGAPKAAGGDWVYPQPKFHWRLESSGDPVTTYPLAAAQWFLNKIALRVAQFLVVTGWQHYGRNLVLTDDGSNNYWSKPKFPKLRGLEFSELGQHYLANYLARIQLRGEFIYPE